MLFATYFRRYLDPIHSRCNQNVCFTFTYYLSLQILDNSETFALLKPYRLHHGHLITQLYTVYVNIFYTVNMQIVPDTKSFNFQDVYIVFANDYALLHIIILNILHSFVFLLQLFRNASNMKKSRFRSTHQYNLIII